MSARLDPGPPAPVRLLTLTSLYPSAAQPTLGLFVEQRLRALVAAGGVAARVIAPVPWFPGRSAVFGRYGQMARVPAREVRHGIAIDHPRFPVIPKIGMTIGPWLLERALRHSVRAALAAERVDLIDAHYFFPDGVAAVMLGRRYRRPVVITARGSDINLVGQYRLARGLMRWAARQSAAVICVSRALAEAMAKLGIHAREVAVLPNGVDLAAFRPVDQESARARLGLRGPTLLSVGNLIDIKGHHLALAAVAAVPAVRLVIIGDGPMRVALHEQARRLGIEDRVSLLGALPQERLPEYYAAADALVLMSAREGMPNVVLEALACGTPVLATPVGGIPEILTGPDGGVLLAERSAPALVSAIARLLGAPPDRTAVRRHAERFGWGPIVDAQVRLYRRVLERGIRPPANLSRPDPPDGLDRTPE
jgi:glycosyltransferase involved in cell wall biosynthesis